MSELSRRRFIQRTGAGAGAILASSAGVALAEEQAKPERPKKITDLVTLGKTGIKTSLIGQGTGWRGVRRASAQLKLGYVAFEKMIRHGYERGMRYFDTADQYGTHIYLRESLLALRKALEKVPQEDVFVLTKTRALTPDVAIADIERFRQELGRDQLDTLLIHCMQASDWTTTMRPVMDVLSKAKDSKKVKAVGVSCHTLGALKATAESDWCDLVLARINPFGLAMDGTVEEVLPLLEKLHDKGCGVIGMKIFANGKIADDAKKRQESLDYAINLPCVDAMTIGFLSCEQIDDTLKMAFPS